jgi:beta-phosphoglucomutase-like phosphatase (HAD superfamily)
MPRMRRNTPISIISVDVPTMLKRRRTMMNEHQQTSDELIAELNGGLRARDPMRIMKQQIRLKTLAEVRQRLSEQRVLSDDTTFDMYPHVDAMLDDLERQPQA